MRAPYVAAKGAVIGLTKTLAIELGPTTSAPTRSARLGRRDPQRDVIVARRPHGERRVEGETRDTRSKATPASSSPMRSPTRASSSRPTPPA
jgi:hypothetical protein